MDDDLNTADALAAIFELVRAANTAAAVPDMSAAPLEAASASLVKLLGVLGLDPLAQDGRDAVPQDVLALVEARTQAKKARNFALADELRSRIQALGFIVADTPQGPKVSRP